jgi:DNA-binding transcriptional regulator YiaG
LALCGNEGAIVTTLAGVGVTAELRRLPSVDVKKIRELLGGISQSEFAARYCLGLDTIQNWEQGRYQLDAAARVLLKAIETCPSFVDGLLGSREQLPVQSLGSGLGSRAFNPKVDRLSAAVPKEAVRLAGMPWIARSQGKKGSVTRR